MNEEIKNKEFAKGLSKIKKIGGKLYEDYILLCREVESLNETIIPLFLNVGYNEAEDTETVLQAIKGGEYAAKRLFIDRMKQKVEAGKIPIESLVPQKYLNQGNTPEEREKKLQSHLLRNIVSRFKKILESHPEATAFYLTDRTQRALTICKRALRLTPSGLIVLPGEFLTVYSDYMKAEASSIYKEQKKTIEAINSFFRGVSLTEKLFFSFFEIRNGVLDINPKSINGESYLCLGKRSSTVSIRKEAPKGRKGNRQRIEK